MKAEPSTTFAELQRDYGMSFATGAQLLHPDEETASWHGEIVDQDGVNLEFEGFADQFSAIVWLAETACVPIDQIEQLAAN